MSRLPSSSGKACLISKRAAEHWLPRVDGSAREGSQHSPNMWAPSIVGYGSYRYTAGFAIRARQLVVYLVAERDRQKFLLSSLASTISASLVCTSRSWLISTSRSSSNSSPARSQRQAARQVAQRRSNPSLEPTSHGARFGSNVYNDQRRCGD